MKVLESIEKSLFFLQTGQVTCHDTKGNSIPCEGTGQDAEYRTGIRWPEPRFQGSDNTVLDRLTGLIWTRNANPLELPLTWQEAFEYIEKMNRDGAFGYSDWRMPNRKELRSLLSYQTKKPALPESHPFENVFSGWYWTSTTAAINPAYAWYIHMEGARMFYGEKRQFFLLWPVRGRVSSVLSATGQKYCYDQDGNRISCANTGQDGEFQYGIHWPVPRFHVHDEVVLDRLTNLCWLKRADLAGKTVTWQEALLIVKELNADRGTTTLWRLPNINELETLVDCSTHSPALPEGHPFENVREGYWSSTTSMYEPDWAWALYLTKGALGVGQKKGAYFHVWPVCSASELIGGGF